MKKGEREQLPYSSPVRNATNWADAKMTSIITAVTITTATPLRLIIRLAMMDQHYLIEYNTLKNHD